MGVVVSPDGESYVSTISKQGSLHVTDLRAKHVVVETNVFRMRELFVRQHSEGKGASCPWWTGTLYLPLMFARR